MSSSSSSSSSSSAALKWLSHVVSIRNYPSLTDCCGANKKLPRRRKKFSTNNIGTEPNKNRTKQENQGINKVFVNSLEKGNYMQWIYRCEECLRLLQINCSSSYMVPRELRSF
ncbi:hypothetical protein PRUPE_6G098700 [Prunus persica]|uniref:Uncharacterized protein n=1 Tax=Prunus persica TaxID=3760 RepID=A0A251NMT8_PRUPE|nr:hypothetical protein PRUPE_6G098700 [Prunus persica]